MNLKNNLVVILLGIGTFLVLALVALLIILDKDPTTYIGSLTTLIGFFIASGLLGSRLQTVAKNVNGNTTKLLEENRQLREQNSSLLAAAPAVDLRDPSEVAPPLMSEDTVGRIQADVDSLPSHRSE